MFFTDSKIWSIISNLARELGNSEEFVKKTKLDYDELINRYTEIRRFVNKKSRKLDASLSMQEFHRWGLTNFPCFFLLIFFGSRHTGLRELRFYLEASIRAYYIDSHYPKTSYDEKVKILNVFKPKKTLEDFKSLQTLTAL